MKPLLSLDEIQEAAWYLLWFAIPSKSRSDRADIREQVRDALEGSPEGWAAAFRSLGRAWLHDVNNRPVPLSKSWVARRAFFLATAVELAVEAEHRGRHIQEGSAGLSLSSGNGHRAAW